MKRLKYLLLQMDNSTTTNFMIRDSMMKELVEKEPLTPFTDRVQELSHRKGVSTVLVIGGSGEYLSVADKIYMMADYRIYDMTARAKEICQNRVVTVALSDEADWSQSRTLLSQGFTSYPEGSGSERLMVCDMGFISVGDENIDVRGLHDIVSKRQLDALGFMLRYLEISGSDPEIDITEKIAGLYTKIDKEGLDCVFSSYFTSCERFLDLPRKQELMALINRMRKASWVTA